MSKAASASSCLPQGPRRAAGSVGYRVAWVDGDGLVVGGHRLLGPVQALQQDRAVDVCPGVAGGEGSGLAVGGNRFLGTAKDPEYRPVVLGVGVGGVEGDRLVVGGERASSCLPSA